MAYELLRAGSRLALRCALIWHLFLPVAELPAGRRPRPRLCPCACVCACVCACAAPLSYTTLPFSVRLA